MNEIKLQIGGKDMAANSGATFERKSPITGAVVSTCAAASAADARAACDAAAKAFPAWSALGPNARRKFLMEAAAKLRAHGADFSRLCVEETGAIAGWGHFNTGFAATLLEEAAAMTTQVIGETLPSDVPGTFAMGVRQAAGVCVGMAPWNAPVILGVRAIAMPLACGNTVVLKASELCPAVHRLIVDCFNEAGLPAGVVNFVAHSAADAPAVVEALIAHPAVKRVNFTGSSRVGRIIGELSGKHLKPCLLELGGKAPLLILDDADLEEAVAAAAFGAFMHQGQICMSTERIIVTAGIADEFLKRFVAKVKTLQVGDPTKGNFPIGACVDAKTVDHVKALITDATAKGAKVLTGGTGSGGAFFEPTVVDGVTKGMRIYGEESFGPVVGVLRARDTEHAVELANDCEYGLSAAVFSRNINTALSVAQRIDSGICHINSPTVQDEAQMPFGGTKASGVGRFGGKAGVAEFTDLRWISISTQHRHYPI
ncbi:MAG: aldehyde dehydrogenase [Proteobacteria bacterium]|nr:aldehyde dehydrogenase [Pseudomonadota bacterium]MBK7116711.1 aldehyde dehydrogenase [Pseudomonadota bacterium]MCC6632577.1 aldehyde dehydrogenase [Gammaproteobacteria bacterium]